MNWIKKGCIFMIDTSKEWSYDCAQVPTVELLSDKVWRIYYASRDSQVRSAVGYFDVEAGNPENILYRHPSPVFMRGELGTFDELGVGPSFLLKDGDTKYLYYIGYNVTKTLPYHNGIGIATWNEEKQLFERISQGPLFERTLNEAFFNASSCVLKDDGIWRIYYLSTTKWVIPEGANRAEPFYHIKYAESENAFDWKREGHVAIDYKDENEAGLARPYVLKIGGKYYMWYSRRDLLGYKTDKNASYRIGYAVSDDAVNWTRMDEKAGIDISPEGWDAEMICYPCVVEWGDKLFLFYNGNGFGRTGIGYAVCDKSELID
ncbi:MAG: hypothetical protein LBH80_00070 [Prevotellaceae bacterium]|jgi:hypothetical protein|nr:hypothetical protein [Prevotellaceae bacterium]